MRIIVAEDEGITRQWLCKTIESFGSGYQLCYAAGNGSQALEYCIAHEVDVLIADIRMPVMDGLTLIENIKKLKPRIQVIVLSAYDQFTYARQAMRLGVNDFLLKPEITSQSLRECLEKISSAVIKEPDQGTAGREYLRQLLNGRINLAEEEIWQNLQEKNIYLKPDGLFVLVYMVEEEEKQGKLYELTLLLAGTGLKTWVSCELEQNLSAVIANGEGESAGRFVQQLYQLLGQHTSKRIFMGISREGNGFLGLSNLYRQAVVAVEFSRFYGEGGLSFYDVLAQHMIGFYSECALTRECKMIRELIADQAYSEGMRGAMKIFATIQAEKNLAPAAVRMIAVEFLMLYMQGLRACRISRAGALQLSEIDLGQSNQKNTMTDLLEWWSQLANDMLLLLKEHTNVYSLAVQTTIGYIREHFAEDIRLERLAEQVFLSPSYLSTLFRKETGEYLRNYIVKVRIEKACFLLLHSSGSISEISDLVGFTDISYFSKVFRKIVGINPSEYREVK